MVRAVMIAERNEIASSGRNRIEISMAHPAYGKISSVLYCAPALNGLPITPFYFPSALNRSLTMRKMMGDRKQVKIINRTTGRVLIQSARWCQSRLCRLVGLQFRRRLSTNEALLLVMAKDSVPQSSIHMFFVFFPITAVWINSDGKVTSVQLAKPWRPYYASPEPARFVLETSPSHLKKFKVGDEVDFVPS